MEATTEETSPTLDYVVFFFPGLVAGVLLGILSYWGFCWYQPKETKSSEAIERASEPTPELTSLFGKAKMFSLSTLRIRKEKSFMR